MFFQAKVADKYQSVVQKCHRPSQPQCPQTDKRIKIMFYIHMQCYSAMKIMGSHHPQTSGWNWGTSCYPKPTRLRTPNVACFSSLWNMGRGGNKREDKRAVSCIQTKCLVCTHNEAAWFCQLDKNLAISKKREP